MAPSQRAGRQPGWSASRAWRPGRRRQPAPRPRPGGIEADLARSSQLEEHERALSERFEPWRLTREEMQTAEATIERQRIQLTAELDGLMRRASDIERRLRGADEAQTAFERLTVQLAAYEEIDRQLVAARGDCETANRKLAGLRQEGERLKGEGALVQQRVDLLGAHEECPLCGQVLGADGLTAAQTRLTGERKGIEAKLEQTRKEWARCQAAVKTGEERQRGLQEQLAGRATVERALGDADGQIRAAEQDRKELAEVQTHLDALQQQLAANDFAAEARVAREQAAARLVQIAYDPEEHRKVREAKDAVRGAPDVMRKLDAARVVLTTAASHRGDLQAQRETAQTEASALEAEHTELQQQLAQLPAVRAELAGKERELQTAGAALRQASQLLGEARQMVAWLAGQERERETLARAQVIARQEDNAYLQLAEAFGKNGIQEMLVDRALPDIQDQANELLAKLSGGRMRIELSTQRTGRMGGTISTLDVNVSDELGTRPYELFSGGERFRIDFAIRIALSRYLATRAGAPLQMLAIDEGFGSQDREGCDRMIEAIRSIEDDFERILIITHLDEMKDVFPVRIEVTKTAKGSTFSIT